MLKWASIFFVISLVAGVMQFTQFTDVQVLEVEASVLLSFGFLIPFIVFLVFGLLALGNPELDANKHPVMDGIKFFLGWR